MKPSTNGRPASAPAASREAKRLAATILEVLAGLRTPAQAAALVNVSLPRYYQLEVRAMDALVQACEPRPKGRQRGPLNPLTALTQENERLRRDLGRQQTLTRLAQRSVGLAPAVPPAKGRRKRKTARALVTAGRLRATADGPDAGHAAGSG